MTQPAHAQPPGGAWPQGPAQGAMHAPPPVVLPSPLAAVEQLGRREARDGLFVGFILALLMHTATLAIPETSLWEMREVVKLMRDELHAYLWQKYDVDLIKDEKKKEDVKIKVPIPEEVPEEQIEQQPLPTPDAPETPQDPYPDDPPPAPAKAADVVTAEDDAVDLSGDGWDIVDHDGSDTTGGGYTASEGTEDKAVHNRHAKVGGKSGATGTGKVKPPPPPPPKKKNLSRAGRPKGTNWNCPFPAQADLHQVDRASAMVAVTVGKNGRATRVRVTSDPGYGFGANAKACAMTKQYAPALNADGKPIVSTIVVRVTFRRR